MAELTFKFNESEVTFNFNNENLKVNATQMAKIFGKEVARFMENDSTENFIQACLKTRNSAFLNIQNREDLYTSVQKTGTWMHRILALKFAAWLDPDFEVWVYSTMDKIVFGDYYSLKKSLKESAARKVEMDTLREELREHPRFKTLETLELQERQAAYGRGKFNNSQIRLFREPEDNALDNSTIPQTRNS